MIKRQTSGSYICEGCRKYFNSRWNVHAEYDKKGVWKYKCCVCLGHKSTCVRNI